VVALTEQVSDTHLAGLRKDGVSYFFADKRELDLRLVLETLNRELGVKRLLLKGGGTASGEFLRADLVDAVRLAICPTVDGVKGAPSVFDSRAQDSDVRAPIAAMSLENSEVLDGGAVSLRYRIRNAAPGV
jgi:riboflavin biosynthesis pyrimidine reductase